MTNIGSILQKIIPFWVETAPGLAELANLLELLPTPAILIDNRSNKIAGVNSKVLRFTAYTRAEISQISLGHLFPGIKDGVSVKEYDDKNENHSTQMSMRSGEYVDIYLQAISLDAQQTWLVLLFEPLSQRNQLQADSKRQENFLQTFNDLILAGHINNEYDFTSTTLNIGRRLLGTANLALYIPDPARKYMRLYLIAGEQTNLPEQIFSKDVLQLRSPYLWKPGAKILSELHRVAFKQQIKYMASAPINDSQNLYGILVAFDTNNPPGEQLFPYLQILAQFFEGRFKVQTTLEALTQNDKEKIDDLFIRKHVIENIQDGVILLSPDLNIIEMNPSTECILGYAEHEVKGQYVGNVLIGADNLTPALQLAKQGTESPSLGNMNLHRRDGQTFAAHIQVIPVKTDENVLGIIVVLQDLSEHHKIKVRTQQLEQSALLGEVTEIFAHEVRNPINNISMGLQFMQLNMALDDPNRAHIDRLKQDCDRLIELMITVRSFSRSANYKMEPIDIYPVIDRVLSRWKPHMAREKVKPHIQQPKEHPLINGNASAIEQVFNNLVSNAIQAMHAIGGGELNIKIKQTNMPTGSQAILVSIGDSGPGIPEDLRKRIFEPFFTTDTERGTGLGLAIAQHIVTSHKGTIEVDSFPGGGTVFHVRFPTINSQQNTEELIS
jgi:PAS domain S-box-containing protein